MTHIPYRATRRHSADLIAGRVQLMIATLSAGVLPQIKEGRLRVLSTLLPNRSPLLPELSDRLGSRFAQPHDHALGRTVRPGRHVQGRGRTTCERNADRGGESRSARRARPYRLRVAGIDARGDVGVAGRSAADLAACGSRPRHRAQLTSTFDVAGVGCPQASSSRPTRSRRPAGVTALAGTGSPATSSTRLNRPRRNGFDHRSPAGAREERAPQVLQRQRNDRHRVRSRAGFITPPLNSASCPSRVIAPSGKMQSRSPSSQHRAGARERLLVDLGSSTFCGAIGIALAQPEEPAEQRHAEDPVVHDEADRPRARRHQQHRRR